jgi:hypothetical protein
VKIRKCSSTGRLNLDILMAYLGVRNKSNVPSQFAGADVSMQSDSSVTVIYSTGYFFWSRRIICFSYVFLPTLIFCSHISHDIAQHYNLWGAWEVYIHVYIYIHTYMYTHICHRETTFQSTLLSVSYLAVGHSHAGCIC